MGYALKWTPPLIVRDNLASWKDVFNDLHAKLIASGGLVQTDTTGQLDIDGVSALPADGTFEGFREYAFNDELQETAPIIMKIWFGCGVETLANGSSASYYRSRTPRVKIEVFFKGALVSSTQQPQEYNASGSATTALTHTGSSFITVNYDLGFFGLVYGAGSRNKPHTFSLGSYYGSTACVFIQRTVVGGTDAVMVYSPSLPPDNTNYLWTNGILPLTKSFFSFGGAPVSRTDMAPRVGHQGHAGGLDQVILEPIYAPSNPPTMFPHIFSYWHELIIEGQEFDFTVNGETRNYIALGRETCISVDSVDGQRAGIAMLFE